MEHNRKSIFRSGEGAGKSGSFFFFSHDNQFLIKTATDGEKNLLVKLLDPMTDHISNLKNESLLARIYGIFTISSNVFASVSIILMQNTVKMTNSKNKKITFDLKGSQVKRYTKLCNQ